MKKFTIDKRNFIIDKNIVEDAISADVCREKLFRWSILRNYLDGRSYKNYFDDSFSSVVINLLGVLILNAYVLCVLSTCVGKRWKKEGRAGHQG
jgi:hypothetical protein